MRTRAVVAALTALIVPAISTAPAGAGTLPTAGNSGAGDVWEQLAQSAALDTSSDHGPQRNGLDAAFGGYQVVNGEDSITADIVVPQVACPERIASGADRVNRKDEAVVAAAVEVGDGRVNGGAGVIAGCDYEGSAGLGEDKYLPVLFSAGRQYEVVNRPVAVGDIVRAGYVADPVGGTATSSLENVTQGWTVTTAPYPYIPGGYAEIGDRRIRRDPFPGFRQFIPLPNLRRNSFESVVVDGVELSAATGEKIDMVLPISGDPQIVPSDVSAGGFTLTRII